MARFALLLVVGVGAILGLSAQDDAGTRIPLGIDLSESVAVPVGCADADGDGLAE